MNKGYSLSYRLGSLTATVLIGVVKFAFILLAAIGKAAWSFAAPLAASLMPLPKRQEPAMVKETATAAFNVPPMRASAEEAKEGPATVIQERADFEGCDRIVSIRLEPPVGVINLRIYYASRVVKRDLIITEQNLKQLMRGRRHHFPDTQYDPVAGLDSVKDDTIALAEKLINELGNQAVKGKKPRKDDFVRAAAAAPSPVQQPAATKPIEQPSATPWQPPRAAEGPSQVHSAAPGRMVTPVVTTGFTYEGRLTKAGPQQQRPPGRRPFEVFEATLLLDNGAELALRGAELERELTVAGCQLGNRVAITPMGKVPVQLGNGEEGKKNLYKVQNLTGWK